MAKSPLIVVGVDGSPASVAALRWAARQAELTGGRLEAVRSWQYPTQFDEIFYAETSHWSKSAETSLSDALAEAGIGDDVACERTVIEGHPAAVLVSRCVNADLLVVGSRGHGGFAGLLLGSVSSAAIARAACPVVVVRHHEIDASSEDPSTENPSTTV